MIPTSLALWHLCGFVSWWHLILLMFMYMQNFSN